VRTLYEVVLDGGKGRTVFQTHDVGVARTVRGNYVSAGAVIVPDPDAEQKGAADTAGQQATGGDDEQPPDDAPQEPVKGSATGDEPA
jgi:hypothetical protein